MSPLPMIASGRARPWPLGAAGGASLSARVSEDPAGLRLALDAGPGVGPSWLVPTCLILLAAAIGLALWLRRRLKRTRAEADEARSRLAVITQDLESARKRARALAVMAHSAKALRNEFLSNISHEVRTPMNTILGMTDLLLETDPAPKQRRYLEKVRAAGHSLLDLLNDLLDLSRIHARRLSLDPQGFRLRDCIGDVTVRFRPQADRKQLTLRCDADPDVPDEVVGDPGRLRQVLGTLLSNAIKFTETGEVRVHAALVSEDAAKAEVQFTVTDTGIGIPKEAQAKVFEAFRQLDGSATRTHGGCGIGLAIASQLVALMGGRITVESESGRGSTLHFTIRLGLRQEAEAPLAPCDLSRLSRLRALVVNSQSDIRESLVTMLGRLRMESVAVADAGAAFAALRQARADGRPRRFVLLDATTPGGNVFDLAATIAGKPDYGRPAIVLVTHAGRRGDVARCRELGLAAYLTFPLSVAELAQALLMILDGRSAAAGPQQVVTTHLVREQLAAPLSGLQAAAGHATGGGR
ncbi:MAG TPA: ATP-binding protein [Phycisphaerae bacterium]|nr:ATP-binding protein [Phycisphaerae bacterium]